MKLQLSITYQLYGSSSVVFHHCCVLWKWLVNVIYAVIPPTSSHTQLADVLLLSLIVFAVCQMFPKLDIRNVVEATEEVTIKNWCGFGHSSCHHEFSVRPFRCLGMTANMYCWSSCCYLTENHQCILLVCPSPPKVALKRSIQNFWSDILYRLDPVALCNPTVLEYNTSKMLVVSDGDSSYLQQLQAWF